jgi:hypothetical protein
LTKKQNPLDWYHDNVCSSCDRPDKKCPEGSHQEIACILAAVLKEVRGAGSHAT